MKIKKFIAATMPEAMKKVKEELGTEAVILNAKEVSRGGFLGRFKRKCIEVTAALDPQPISQRRAKRNTPNQTKSYKINDDHANGKLEKDVLHEIKYLKKILEKQATDQGENSYPLDYQLVYDHLLGQEVNNGLAKEIVESVINRHKLFDVQFDQQQIKLDIQSEIEKRLTDISFQGGAYQERIIHFVGPTGVGKTTTLAKIGANLMLQDGKKVAFITTDTYRIAAIEQLKTYARILDVPVAVAYTPEDYKQAVEKFSSFDAILVDTAGRNFREHKYVKELEKNIHLDTKTYLVLSLTAKPKDIIDIHKQFEHLLIKGLIFTKVDETLQYGSMLNIALQKKNRISYITNGQDVPDDIIQPTPKRISNFIMGGYLNE